MKTTTPTFSKKPRRYIRFLLPLASLFLLLVMGELALRTWHYFRWHVSFLEGQPGDLRNLSPITVDAQLGWRATPNYRFSGKKRSADKTEYSVDMSQDANGFRMFGDLTSSARRVFVIGDSFTQAVQVSDDKTYYAPLKALNMNVFAYGGGGYGSLQEYMILDKYFDVIKPDLIIWQYSTNDIVNNSPELEAASTINNNDMVRPYLVDETVQYILPRNHAAALRLFALRYSRLLYIILNSMDRLRTTLPLHTVEMESSPGEVAHPQFLKALATTDEIIGKVRRRVGRVPIVGFIVGADKVVYGPEYIEGFQKVSLNHQVMLADVEYEVLKADRLGTVVIAEDKAHWNEMGHHIASLALTKFLSEHKLLEPKGNR